MLGWLTGRSAIERRASELYGRVVTSARQPAFYRDLGVADTPEGRFELIALHLFLAAERVKRDRDGSAVAQRLIETFITDMDDCMREMGVGDLTVPKRVKRAAAGFYERAGAYREALANNDDAPLVEAVTEHVYSGAAPAGGAAATLSAYIRRRARVVDGESAETILTTAVPVNDASAATSPRTQN